MKILLFAMPLALISANVVANNQIEGYYGSLKYLQIEQRAQGLDTSSRPGVGEFVAGKEKQRRGGAALAAGYQFGNGWRTEAEYTFKQKTEFTNGSTAFPTGFNHMKSEVERLMLNIYRDYDLSADFALYVTAGLGVSRINTGGWQGNVTREYASNSQNNLTYAVGGGITYSPLEPLSLDLGYRYIDMGKVTSGYNNYVNSRNLKDEQLRAQLVSHEFILGVRYHF